MFLPHRDEVQPDPATKHWGGHTFREFLPVTVVVATLSMFLSCSMVSSSYPDSWTGRYFKNPDRVWAAIRETLIDLDYKVAESNRTDGTIRTEPQAGENKTGIVLSIDQIMNTQDQVSVYVRPSGGDESDEGARKAAADLFIATLDKKLQD